MSNIRFVQFPQPRLISAAKSLKENAVKPKVV